MCVKVLRKTGNIASKFHFARLNLLFFHLKPLFSEYESFLSTFHLATLFEISTDRIHRTKNYIIIQFHLTKIHLFILGILEQCIWIFGNILRSLFHLLFNLATLHPLFIWQHCNTFIWQSGSRDKEKQKFLSWRWLKKSKNWLEISNVKAFSNLSGKVVEEIFLN